MLFILFLVLSSRSKTCLFINKILLYVKKHDCKCKNYPMFGYHPTAEVLQYCRSQKYSPLLDRIFSLVLTLRAHALFLQNNRLLVFFSFHQGKRRHFKRTKWYYLLSVQEVLPLFMLVTIGKTSWTYRSCLVVNYIYL